ncbi:PREDICTED: RNA/RNP complex-1-interacting phosphatase [Vollenhovia emeryi]|uniref:RNA/RNP complex-1-interacting phosphatase n=1 Tax=Vollenhovia emeryi TaxID=411798 RepID=UPI0005F5528C|nr:PREDICTED: RNA/RNP complex-1-interacting phosphatase [Vollenhovia emeryi]
MTGSVPDRWLEYKPFGDAIKGTKIIAFKVPLKDAIAKNLEPEQQFTTKVLLQAFPHLKYIVDLTNTYRYYDKKEFTNAGVKYEKIAIPGRKVPTMDIIQKFFKVMDDFTSTCGEGELIGVHCTHGVNRTGYLICRYLIQQLGWETEDSLKAFGEARGYPVERDIYLAALQQVQRGKKIDTSQVVLTPDVSAVIAPTRKTSLKMRSSVKTLLGRPMGPPGFAMSRRGFANGGPFAPQRFAGPPPGFVPMPPPGMPPIPPMSPPPYGPRPFRYGLPPIRQAMPPTPGPGCFQHPGFPPRPPGPPRMAGPPRLPTGPTARLPPRKMLPPPPPPPPPPPSRSTKQFQVQKKRQVRNGIAQHAVNIRMRRNGPANRIVPKARKEQDFTIDTFEENLLTTTSVAQPRRQTKGRFNQVK